MSEEQIQIWISKYRKAAESWGRIALESAEEGDLGRSRMAARQATKYANMVMQLADGAPFEESVATETRSAEG